MTDFVDLPREVRFLVYRHLPLDEEFVFDLKACQETDDPIEEEDPLCAGLYRTTREFREFARFRYLQQFSAIVERGGAEDTVDFEVDGNPDLEYFERNRITHFAKFTCEFETGEIYKDNEGVFARGRVEVSVDDNRNVTVTGDAECDGSSYDETTWQWFGLFRTEVENWVRADPVGLISWQLMDHINAQLEDEVEDLRARSGDDEEDEDEGEIQADEDEDEDEVEEDEKDSDEQESESGQTEDEDEA